MVKTKRRWPEAKEIGLLGWSICLLFFVVLVVMVYYGGIPVVRLQRLICGAPVMEIGRVNLKLDDAYLCLTAKEYGPYLYQDYNSAPDYNERADFGCCVMFRELREPPPGNGQAIYFTLVNKNKKNRFYGLVEVMSERICGGVLVEGSHEFAERVVKDLDSQLRRQNARKMGKKYKEIRKKLLIRLPDIDNNMDSGKPDKKDEPGTPRRKRWNKSEPEVSQTYPWDQMVLLK